MTRLVSNWERSGITFDISILFSFSLHVKSALLVPPKDFSLLLLCFAAWWAVVSVETQQKHSRMPCGLNQNCLSNKINPSMTSFTEFNEIFNPAEPNNGLMLLQRS